MPPYQVPPDPNGQEPSACQNLAPPAQGDTSDRIGGSQSTHQPHSPHGQDVNGRQNPGSPPEPFSVSSLLAAWRQEYRELPPKKRRETLAAEISAVIESESFFQRLIQRCQSRNAGLDQRELFWVVADTVAEIVVKGTKPDNPEAYLRRSVLNRLHSYASARSHSIPPSFPEGFEAARNATSSTISPEEALDIREKVGKLSPIYREIIEAVYFKQHTIVEASQTLNIGYEAARTRLRRALDELRQIFPPDYDD